MWIAWIASVTFNPIVKPGRAINVGIKGPGKGVGGRGEGLSRGSCCLN